MGGADGASATGAGTYAVPAVNKAEIVDTNGAGDVFHGAYAQAMACGMPWSDAVRYATVAASLKCTKAQGWAQLPSHAEVMAFMNHHPQ